jgi:hypothetical protein
MSSAPDDSDRGRFDNLANWRCCSALAQKHTIAVTSRSPATRLASDASAVRLRVPAMERAPRDWWPTTARASCGAG